MMHVKIKNVLIVSAWVIFCGNDFPARAEPAISIPAGKVGEKFSYRIHIEGGTPPFRFKLAFGALPNGVQLDPETGTLSGTPSATGRQPFAFSITIQDDSDPQQQLEQAFTLKIVPAPLRVVAGRWLL